jgi:hypothetical protein
VFTFKWFGILYVFIIIYWWTFEKNSIMNCHLFHLNKIWERKYMFNFEFLKNCIIVIYAKWWFDGKKNATYIFKPCSKPWYQQPCMDLMLIIWIPYFDHVQICILKLHIYIWNIVNIMVDSLLVNSLLSCITMLVPTTIVVYTHITNDKNHFNCGSLWRKN